MHHFITKLNIELNSRLHAIEIEETDIIKKAQDSIICLKDILSKLRTFIVGYKFKNEAEEIYFFKVIKPEIVSQLIYHVKINNFESKRPLGSFEIQQCYILNELEKLTTYFNNHLEFYRYYRMNSTFLDDKLFIRGREDLHLHLEGLMSHIDPDFSTSLDYLVAKIKANDRLEAYYKAELESLSRKGSSPFGLLPTSMIENQLSWSDSKTALVELIYALCASGSLNQGQCEIRVLTACFEQIFNVRLTDTYRTYTEIKVRSTPTKYIDHLKTALLRRMEEEL